MHPNAHGEGTPPALDSPPYGNSSRSSSNASYIAAQAEQYNNQHRQRVPMRSAKSHQSPQRDPPHRRVYSAPPSPVPSEVWPLVTGSPPMVSVCGHQYQQHAQAAAQQQYVMNQCGGCVPISMVPWPYWQPEGSQWIGSASPDGSPGGTWWQWQEQMQSPQMPSPGMPSPGMPIPCVRPPPPPQARPLPLIVSADGGVLRVDPSEVLYTKLCIYITFAQDGLLEDAVEAIRAGTLSADSFPPIRVLTHRGRIYSLDNRRLWVFKAAKVPSVPVIMMQPYRKLAMRLDSQNYGDTVELRCPQSLMGVVAARRGSGSSMHGGSFGSSADFPQHFPGDLEERSPLGSDVSGDVPDSLDSGRVGFNAEHVSKLLDSTPRQPASSPVGFSTDKTRKDSDDIVAGVVDKLATTHLDAPKPQAPPSTTSESTTSASTSSSAKSKATSSGASPPTKIMATGGVPKDPLGLAPAFGRRDQAC